jgi:uncharacterized membrane protein
MIAALAFDFAEALRWGPPVVLLVVAWAVWSLRRRGLNWRQVAALAALRLLLLALLVFLLARPARITREDPRQAQRPVTVLLDRSESMALEDGGSSRYARAVDFLRDQLLPALKSAGLPVEAELFAADTVSADGPQLVAAKPDGKRTNLGGAIAHAFSAAAHPPVAVIALTDGAANESADNQRALSALVEAAAPFIGVGFGSEQGARTLCLRQVHAPATVATRTAFTISAQLETLNSEDLPAFDLLLFRDGLMHARQTVHPGTGSRQWLESFRLTEETEGGHTYTVQVVPPAVPQLKCPNTTLTAAVRVSDEREVRILYIQGALTWDFKFVNLALQGDPTVKLTGLTRTSKQSIFRQNVESAGELLNGFPTTIEEVAPFRVIVLSNLRASELTPAQQDLLARFCGELGGGLLMIGGAATFDNTWQHSRLEQLLPVVFASNPGVLGLDRAFRMELTEEALQHPVFQIADSGRTRELWAQLPAFTQYGRVDSAKPGAMIWAQHQSEQGPSGRRILMAAQRYGAGLSAVICLQNFWRWRLAKESDPQHFDRFWRQLLRFLSDAGRQEVAIHLADQDLHPQMDVQLVVEKQPSPGDVQDTRTKFWVRVENAQKKLLREELLELQTSRPVEVKFRAETADTYTVSVLDAKKIPVATRPIEIRELNLELQETARNMETLRQWAAVSGGLALKVEDCRDAAEIASQIKAKIQESRRNLELRRPFGVNAWTLALALGCLGGEWLLRKQWKLA